MSYIPKNIKAGLTAKDAAKLIKTNSLIGPFEVVVRSYDHGRDINGNGTAHYICQLHDLNTNNLVTTIVQSGASREQVGYSGAHCGALYALDKLGYIVDESVISSYDYQGTAYYPVTMRGII